MNLNSDEWLNLIFESKNKEYGAYYLRKTSSKRHKYALIITISVVCIAILLMFFTLLIPQPGDSEIKPVNISELRMMEDIRFENIQIPPREEQKAEQDIKNMLPKIVPDEEDIPEYINPAEMAAISKDSTNLTASDSTLLAEHKPISSEALDEPVTYVLNPADSIQKSKSLQSTILRHVYHNLKYPDVAYKQRIKGKVMYSFVVNKDGSISDITLTKGVYIFLDEEVLRVIRSIPNVEPERKDGKPIRVKCYLPVVFSL